jgi:S1-C subfamily serine protease
MDLFIIRNRISVFLLSLICLFVLGESPLRAQAPRLTEEERNTIEIFRQASRGVVHIHTRATKEAPFEKLQSEGRTGTGFVIDRKGYILTNFHVIENMNEIEVILSSGRRLSARVIGTAPQLDTALLQVDALAEDLFPLNLGDSSALQMGQKVIAIGNALGLHNTVTVGVVSALRRTVGEVPIELQDAFIQTDAAINPGSSGGPLLNSAGEVVGMNTAIAKDAQGVGFAVPINFARRVIPDLIEMGHPYRPHLGFSTTEITPSIAKLFGLSLARGLLVEEVLPGTPAAIAGLRAGGRIIMVSDTPYVLGGDIIIAVNGQEVSSSSELAHILIEARPGQMLDISVDRNGQKLDIPIRLEKMQMQF